MGKRLATWRRWFAAAWLFAGVAGAHSGPGPQVRAVLLPPDPAWDGVVIQLRDTLAPQILLENQSDKTVEILDQHDVPFLRIGPDGVHANLTSAAWYNTYSTTGLVVPEKARSPQASPQWSQVSARTSWGWFDPRLSNEDELPAADLERQARQVVGQWRIPAQVDGQRREIRGEYVMRREEKRQRRVHFMPSGKLAEGVVAQLVPGPIDAILLHNRSSQAVTVLGQHDEPFIRIANGQVLANVASPTWREWGRVQLPVEVTQSGVQWQQVAAGDRFSWLEPRTLITDSTASMQHWSIALRVDDQPVTLHGMSSWQSQEDPQTDESHATSHMAQEHGAHHDHAAMSGIEVTEPAPALAVVAYPDEVSGWNIHIQTRHFRFAPEAVNQDHREGEGHAHVYVDGKKWARVYGAWYHLSLPSDAPHTLRVELNANTHAPLLNQGQPIEAHLQLMPH